ncbi:MAG: calcium-translocating P-type ATPase, PMCA-type [Bacilli bacterium]|nr:calcium-translocating P-type ATPase, PMCA-type [Bacilli bacterium]
MFETKSIQETLTTLEVDPNQGLSNEEVSLRQQKYGLNQLKEKKKKPLILVFLSNFNDPMIYILLLAVILSVGISLYNTISHGEPFDFADPIIILFVVFLNAIISTVQEKKSEKSLDALKKLASPTCNVRRNGLIQEIKSSDLVVGDIVILEEGRTVPADLRLIKSFNLKTDESSLTGESLPIDKSADLVFSDSVPLGDRANIVYMSTPVTYGHGEGVVIGTGMETETGKIASLLDDGKVELTPLQKKLAQLSKFLGILTIFVVIIIFGIQFIELCILNPLGADLWISAIIDNFMFAISLAVAAVPEGLPAVVSIVLALGVQKMVKANTIVRKLPSVETLGAVQTVCSDKTGTLTQNKMTVVSSYINHHFYEGNDILIKENTLLATGLCLCNDASIDNGVYGDPTEICLVEYAHKLNLSKKELENIYPRLDEIPFDSKRKMMSTLHRQEDKKIIFTKGALDQILKHVKHIDINGQVRLINDKDIDEINKASEMMAKKAYRVLCLAYHYQDTIDEDNLIFLGFVGMIDPPREEAKAAVEKFKNAGINTIMITGDHILTALAIAKNLGIAIKDDEAMLGEDIDKLSEDELREKVKYIRVFARVSPMNKVQIVKALKANGQIVAMTGDGVNDAPSLKTADIGIAMGITGTDVAKSASDMILVDDNFSSIEKAVEEGRGIFDNIKKTVIFLLSTNIAEVLTMLVVVILSLFTVHNLATPLIAIHILWVNLITDSLPAVSLGAMEKSDDVMDRLPRNPKESLFAKGGYLTTFGFGLVITLITLLAFFSIPFFEKHLFTLSSIAEALENDPVLLRKCQTMAFSTLSIGELFHMFGMANMKKSFIHLFHKKNILLFISFLLGISLQFFVTMVPGVNTFFSCYPLDFFHWIYVFAFALIPLVIHEIIVLISYLKQRKK